MSKILDLQNITYTHAGNASLLQNVSLQLEEQKIYALMGANGSGKTTMVNLITGFLKPQSGRIFFRGKDITFKPSFKINRIGISRTFQDLRLISKLTVSENVLLAMQGNPTDLWFNALLPKSFLINKLNQLKKTTEEIINDFLLQDVKNNLAGEISFGQQKLLNLACCTANGAQLLLLDEPLAGVNEEYITILQDKIRKMVVEGKTIFLIDHHTDFVGDIAENIFFLNQGKIEIFQTIEELKNDPNVIATYM